MSRVYYRTLRLSRSVMRLLQVVSNPALLAKEIGFAHERPSRPANHTSDAERRVALDGRGTQSQTDPVTVDAALPARIPSCDRGQLMSTRN
jgi:hypothetical protein